MDDIGYLLEETSEGVDLVVTGQWRPEVENQLRHGVDGLVLNYARGFSARNLDFLRGLPIRRLRLLAYTIADLEPIHALGETLESLSVEELVQ